LLLLMGACLSATAGVAQAQTTSAPAPAAAEPTAVTTGEVVVTARRRAEDVSKVPISITAFSGATLDKKGVAASPIS
jgi:iron complex outermembrane receptor protein